MNKHLNEYVCECELRKRSNDQIDDLRMSWLKSLRRILKNCSHGRQLHINQYD